MIFGSEKVCLYAGSQPKIATSENRTALKHIESSKNNTTTFYGSRKGTIQKKYLKSQCFFFQITVEKFVKAKLQMLRI